MIVHNPEDGSFQFNTEDSFYPAMRLFVPSCDSRSFGCKEVCFSRLKSLHQLNALVAVEHYGLQSVNDQTAGKLQFNCKLWVEK